MDYQIQKRGLRGPHYATQGAEARCEVEHPSFGVIPFVLKVSRITYLSSYQRHACDGATIKIIGMLLGALKPLR